MKIRKTWMGLAAFIAASHLSVSFASSKEITLGSRQAPVTLIEYGSLTCDYCISFHRNVLPRVKRHYIDAGKVLFVYRHFPTSEAAKHGAVAAQCAGDKFYEMLDVLYSTVPDWYQAENKNNIFVQKVAQLGLNSDTYLSCLNDPKQIDDITRQQNVARKDSDVRGTPTFVIDGEFMRGKKSFVEIKELLDRALKKGN